jgi:hypothetical protein
MEAGKRNLKMCFPAFYHRFFYMFPLFSKKNISSSHFPHLIMPFRLRRKAFC